MEFDVQALFDSEMAEHAAVTEAARELLPAYETMLAAWLAAVEGGGKILFFGNGGSASDAQHLATELTVRYRTDRRALPAIALTTDTSALTAAANDFGYESVFARQIEAIGRPGDVAVGISTSGNSVNVLRALETAQAMGIVSAALTGGSGGKLVGLAEPIIIVPSATTARIQEMHILLGQMLCLGLEKALRLS